MDTDHGCGFGCKYPINDLQGGVQPAPKKSEKTKKASEIEVTFTASPREFLHFNRYWVEKNGSFLQISLWFLDSLGMSIPVFRGLIWKTDFETHIPQLKNYLVKVIGGPGDTLPITPPPIWNTPPVAFNILDCVSRGDFAEIVIRNFSHKFVTEAASAKTRMEGITHGIYVSSGNLHRQLVMELIKEADSPTSK